MQASSVYTVLLLLVALFGGSGVVISGVISLLIWVISIDTLLITLLITTHEPPSRSSIAQTGLGVFAGSTLTLAQGRHGFQATSPTTGHSGSSGTELHNNKLIRQGITWEPETIRLNRFRM